MGNNVPCRLVQPELASLLNGVSREPPPEIDFGRPVGRELL